MDKKEARANLFVDLCLEGNGPQAIAMVKDSFRVPVEHAEFLAVVGGAAMAAAMFLGDKMEESEVLRKGIKLFAEHCEVDVDRLVRLSRVNHLIITAVASSAISVDRVAALAASGAQQFEAIQNRKLRGLKEGDGEAVLRNLAELFQFVNYIDDMTSGFAGQVGKRTWLTEEQWGNISKHSVEEFAVSVPGEGEVRAIISKYGDAKRELESHAQKSGGFSPLGWVVVAVVIAGLAVAAFG